MWLYGSQFWNIRKKEEREIEAVEMRYSRTLAAYTLSKKEKLILIGITIIIQTIIQ